MTVEWNEKKRGDGTRKVATHFAHQLSVSKSNRLLIFIKLVEILKSDGHLEIFRIICNHNRKINMYELTLVYLTFYTLRII